MRNPTILFQFLEGKGGKDSGGWFTVAAFLLRKERETSRRAWVPNGASFVLIRTNPPSRS